MTVYRSGQPRPPSEPRATNPYHREVRPDAKAFWEWCADAPAQTCTKPQPDPWRQRTTVEIEDGMRSLLAGYFQDAAGTVPVVCCGA